MKTLIIIGAGGHGRVVADCAEATNKYQKIVFLDDCYPQRSKNLHWDIIGSVSSFKQYAHEQNITNTYFIVALGNNQLRAQILNKLNAEKLNIASIIHPTAIISSHSYIKKGVVVFANAVINIGSTINVGTIVNTASTIDHDCNIGECVHISPGVHIAGGVTIEKNSWVGIGASIIECITLKENTQIAAGSVVIESTKENSLYAGVPAVFKKQLTIKNTLC